MAGYHGGGLRWGKETTGLKCASETVANIKIKAYSPAPVAAAFSNSSAVRGRALLCLRLGPMGSR